MINNQIRNFRKTLRQFERQLGFQKEKCIIGNTLSKCHTLLEIEELKEATTGRIARKLAAGTECRARKDDCLPG